jgi:hypothetical protein
LTFSTLITSSAATRYCLPPVLMTANMALSSVRYGGRVDGPASYHLRLCGVTRAYGMRNPHDSRRLPLAEISA